MMKSIRVEALVLSTVVGLGLLGPSCGRDEATADESPALSTGGELDQVSSDVTVLRAAATAGIGGNGQPGFDLAKCEAIAENRYDCTKALEERTGLPALQQVTLSNSSTSSFFCRVLEVTTVSKTAAVERSDGIGFYYSGWGTSTRFIKRGDLKQVGEATLKNGEPAQLHAFAGLANCWLGSASSSANATYQFKPYMSFVDETGNEYRNWDYVDRNYVIATRIPAFDRAGELVQ